MFGYFFAQKTTDARPLYNIWYNRPDLKPYAAMVKPDADEEEKMHMVRYSHYADYRKKMEKEDFWRSAAMRYFLPQYADWTIR